MIRHDPLTGKLILAYRCIRLEYTNAMSIRLDYKPLTWVKRPDGRYHVHVTLGEVDAPLKYTYFNGDEIKERTEIVTEDGLFNDRSVTSVTGLPILLKHPKRQRYNLNEEGLRIGTILGTHIKEDTKLISEAVIDDYRAVKIIDQLLAARLTPEASSCYFCDRMTPRSDGVLQQYRGLYDHVAAPLYPGRGRAGRNVTVRFDSGDTWESNLDLDIKDLEKDAAIATPLYFFLKSDEVKKSDETKTDTIDPVLTPKNFDIKKNTKGKEKMIHLRLDADGKKIKIVNPAEELDAIAGIEALQVRIDELEESETELIKSNIALEGSLDAAKQQLEEVNQKIEELQAQLSERSDSTEINVAINDEVARRLDFWNVVTPILEAKDPKRENWRVDYSQDSYNLKKEFLLANGVGNRIKLDSIDPDTDVGKTYIDAYWDAYQSGYQQSQSRKESQKERSDESGLSQARADSAHKKTSNIFHILTAETSKAAQDTNGARSDSYTSSPPNVPNVGNYRKDSNKDRGYSDDPEFEVARQEESRKRNTKHFSGNKVMK